MARPTDGSKGVNKLSDALTDIFGDDEEVLRSIGPATIRAFGGADELAMLLAGIARRENSAHTQLKALAIAGQWIKTSAEIRGGEKDGDKELADLDQEIAALLRQKAGSSPTARDDDKSDGLCRGSEVKP